MSNFTTANVYLQTNQWFPCKLWMTTDGLQGTKEITKKFLMGHLSDFIQQHPETSCKPAAEYIFFPVTGSSLFIYHTGICSSHIALKLTVSSRFSREKFPCSLWEG